MSATFDPEPSAEEREAILRALAAAPAEDAGWEAAALAEGVEEGDSDP